MPSVDLDAPEHAICSSALAAREMRIRLLQGEAERLRTALRALVAYEWGRTGDTSDLQAVERAASLPSPASAPWRNAAALCSTSAQPKGEP